MGSCAKYASILLMAILMVAICHAKCSEENSPLVSDTNVPIAGDKVESSLESVTTEVAKESETAQTKKVCECATDSVDSSVPKSEQVVIKKVGKNKVITITLPVEAQGIEYVVDATTTTTKPATAESDTVEKEANSDEDPKGEETPKTLDPTTPEENEGLEEVEAVKPAPEETKKQKAKVDKSKKKFKRDVGKKSSEKKSSKSRKNKEQKRKSKK